MERRSEQRYKLNAEAEVTYGNNTINAKALEISKHGIKIESAEPIEPGTKVETVLFLKEPERISGEVKWVIAEPGQEKVIYKIGIGFIADSI